MSLVVVVIMVVVIMVVVVMVVVVVVVVRLEDFYHFQFALSVLCLQFKM